MTKFLQQSSAFTIAATWGALWLTQSANLTAGITIDECYMKDKTNVGVKVTTGYGQSILLIDFVSVATTDCYAGGLTFTWSFGDGQTATGQNVSHAYGYGNGGNYTVTLTVTDDCSNSATTTVNPKVIDDIEVLRIGDILNPSGNGRLCFDAERRVEARALPVGVNGSNLIDWSVSVHGEYSKLINTPTGQLPPLPKFPTQNSKWGAQYLYATIDFSATTPDQNGELNLTGPVSYIESKELINVFYDLLGYQNPHPGGADPKPKNWFYYWTQTSADYGTMNYTLSGPARGWCNWDNPDYTCYMIDSTTAPYPVQSVPATAQNAGQTLTYIDSFAWIARHEWRHHNQMDSWWGAGGHDPGEDQDGDGIPDDTEDLMTTADGGPFDITELDTYGGDWLDDDMERNAVVTQAAWTKDSADGED